MRPMFAAGSMAIRRPPPLPSWWTAMTADQQTAMIERVRADRTGSKRCSETPMAQVFPVIEIISRHYEGSRKPGRRLVGCSPTEAEAAKHAHDCNNVAPLHIKFVVGQPFDSDDAWVDCGTT